MTLQPIPSEFPYIWGTFSAEIRPQSVFTASLQSIVLGDLVRYHSPLQVIMAVLHTFFEIEHDAKVPVRFLCPLPNIMAIWFASIWIWIYRKIPCLLSYCLGSWCSLQLKTEVFSYSKATNAADDLSCFSSGWVYIMVIIFDRNERVKCPYLCLSLNLKIIFDVWEWVLR